MKSWIATTKDGKSLLTIIAPETKTKGNLKAASIVGEFTDVEEGKKPDLTKFKHNLAFLKLFHTVVKEESMKAPAMIESAKKKGNGTILIVDGREKNREKPEKENIVGMLEIKDGKIIVYKLNKLYRVLTKDGFFKLPPEVEKAILKKLAK